MSHWLAKVYGEADVFSSLLYVGGVLALFQTKPQARRVKKEGVSVINKNIIKK